MLELVPTGKRHRHAGETLRIHLFSVSIPTGQASVSQAVSIFSQVPFYCVTQVDLTSEIRQCPVTSHDPRSWKVNRGRPFLRVFGKITPKCPHPSQASFGIVSEGT